MKTVAIIQARMGSTRLPGKILADLGGTPVLAWVVRAARAATLVDHVIVATTTNPEDEATVAVCQKLGVDVVRGPVDDVLSRFLLVMAQYPSEWVVRLTADCPLLDPELIDAAVSLAGTPALPDYVSTTLIRTLPRGLDVEVVRSSTLRRASAKATGFHRIHVTSHLYQNPDTFRCLGVSTILNAGDLRMTLDTREDLEVLRRIVGALGNNPHSAAEVVTLARSRPGLVSSNQSVRQKEMFEG